MFDPADIGSAADEPADLVQLGGGQTSLNPTSGKRLTLFALLKLLALELHALNEVPGKTGAGE